MQGGHVVSEARSGTAAVGQESRKLLVVGGLVVAALLALALWADRHRWEEPGVPVTAPTAPTPTPTIDPYAGDFEELTEELRWRVLAAAGVDQPTEVDCETDGIPDRSGTYGCTVTYDGVEVPFKVHFDVSEDLYGRRRSDFEIVQKKTVLTKEGVFAAFWRYGKERGYTEPRAALRRHPRDDGRGGGRHPLPLLLQVGQQHPPPQREGPRRRARSGLLPPLVVPPLVVRASPRTQVS